MGWLTVEILRGVGASPARNDDIKNFATADSARAACLAGLVTASISSGDADPGLRFYIALSAIFCCREISREAFFAGARTSRRTPTPAAHAPGALYSERPT